MNHPDVETGDSAASRALSPVQHEPTLVRTGYDVRYVCSCGWATPWFRDMARAGAAVVRHASRAADWAA